MIVLKVDQHNQILMRDLTSADDLNAALKDGWETVDTLRRAPKIIRDAEQQAIRAEQEANKYWQMYNERGHIIEALERQLQDKRDERTEARARLLRLEYTPQQVDPRHAPEDRPRQPVIDRLLAELGQAKEATAKEIAEKSNAWQQVAKLEGEKEKLQLHIQELDRQIRGLHDTIRSGTAYNKTLIAQREADVRANGELRESIRKLQGEIGKMTHTIGNQGSVIGEFQEQLAIRDATIAELRHHINEHIQQANEYDPDLDSSCGE